MVLADNVIMRNGRLDIAVGHDYPALTADIDHGLVVDAEIASAVSNERHPARPSGEAGLPGHLSNSVPRAKP